MNRKNAIGLILIVLSILAMPARAQVTVEATIDSLSILLGEQTRVHLEVTCEAEQDVIMPIFQDSLPSTVADVGPFSQIRDSLSCDIEIIGEVKTDTTFLNGGKRKTISQDYQITSFNPGFYQIAGFEVLVDSVSYFTPDIALKVIIYEEVLPKNNFIDDEYKYSFFGIKDIRKAPVLFSEIKPTLYALGIIAQLVLLFLYLLKHYRTNSPILQRVTLEPVLPAHIKAQKALEEIREEKGWAQENSKKYYTELTDALRLYIQNRFGVNATEMTTEEVLTHLSKISDEKQLEEIRDLLTTADFAKFAKFHPLQNEKLLHFDVVTQYVDSTKEEQDESEEPKIEYIVVKKGLSPTAKAIMLGSIIVVAIAAVALLCWIVYFVINLFI